MDQKKLLAIRDFILSAEKSIQSAKKLLGSLTEGGEGQNLEILDTSSLHSYTSEDQKIVEGVFTGESMLGPDGNMYPVPQNYSSKSHLVQGSKLKAIIHGNGKIVYKIIEEIPYDTITGLLTKNRDRYQVIADGKTYNVLLAAVTYIKGEVGDSIAIRIPKGKDATFAAIEAKIPKTA